MKFKNPSLLKKKQKAFHLYVKNKIIKNPENLISKRENQNKKQFSPQ